ncbi:MAG: phasin family protein [Rhodoferax sp.]
MAFSGFSGSVIEAIIHLKDRQMNNPLEQFSATNKVSLEAIEGMAIQAFPGVEKLVELNLATTKSAPGESFSYAHAALGAKDAPELMALQSDLLKPMADKAAVYMQHAPTIGTSSSVEFTKIIEVKTGEAQKAFGGVLENLTRMHRLASSPPWLRSNMC